MHHGGIYSHTCIAEGYTRRGIYSQRDILTHVYTGFQRIIMITIIIIIIIIIIIRLGMPSLVE